MKEDDFKKVMMTLITIGLLVLAFIIIQPIIIAVLFGLILSYIFFPVYTRLYSKIKSPNISALLVVLGCLLVLLVPIIILIPIIANQAVDVYITMQTLDVSTALQESFPSFFSSLSNPADIAAAVTSFTSHIANLVLSTFQQILFNIPSILLQTVVVVFTFFFMLRDHDEMKIYFFSLSPFSKETQQRFYNKFEQVTNSIIYGQLIVGLAQGIIAGAGYFIFGVPNALLLTILTMLVGIIPVIGPWLVWMPIDIYLFASGNTGAALGLLIYGLLVVNWIDSLIRPLVVSRMTKMNSAIALIGMVGGLYVFGIIGLILGPLVLAYLLLIAEFYKEKRFKSIIIQEKEPNPILPAGFNALSTGRKKRR